MASKVEILNLSRNVDVVHLFIVYVYKLMWRVERWKFKKKARKCLYGAFTGTIYIYLNRRE